MSSGPVDTININDTFCIHDQKGWNSNEEVNEFDLHKHAETNQAILKDGTYKTSFDITSILPYEVCMKIFQYLDINSLINCSYICKTWLKLSRDQILYKRLLFSSPWSSIDNFSNNNSKCFKCHSNQNKSLRKVDEQSFDWFDEFKRQFQIRRNWLKGRYKQRIFTGHTSVVNCVVYNGDRIISGSADTTIRVWNLRTNASWSVQTLYGHSQTVRCLQLLDCCVSKSIDDIDMPCPSIKLKNSTHRSLDSGENVPNAYPTQTHCCLLSTGTRDVQLVSGSNDCTIKIWALKSRHLWSSILCRATLTGHTDFVRCLQADHEKIVSGSYDTTLRIWSMESGKLLKTLRGHKGPILCLQYDEEIIVSGSLDKTIMIWKFSGECISTLSGHLDPVACIHLNRYSNLIISGSHDNTLKCWKINNSSTNQVQDGPCCVRTINWMEGEGHSRVIRCLEADQSQFISGSDDKTIKVWNLEDGTRLQTFHGHKDGVTCLQFNNEMLVSGSYDKSVIMWDFSIC